MKLEIKDIALASFSIIIVLLAFQNYVLKKALQKERNQSSSSETYNISLDSAPVIGNINAAVTLVEFADFDCSECRRGNAVIQELKKNTQEK